MKYLEFLKNKVVIAEQNGFEPRKPNSNLFEHQKDLALWMCNGGRRALFASFGMGKTVIQLEVARQVILETGKPFLIVMPLSVSGEFKRDNEMINTGYDITYITDSDQIASYDVQIFITNYERVRKGDIDASKFGGVSFDEASILRSLKTETSNYVLQHFKQINYRFVATATPTPNDYIEILNYADYLGVIDRGHALTRFFKRDSQKAGNLKLLENKEKEFWQWVSTWAAFINKPSDLGYSDDGYDLEPIVRHEEMVDVAYDGLYQDKKGNNILFRDISRSLIETSREKRDSIKDRCAKAYEIAKRYPSAVLWHHLEAERKELERLFKEDSYVSVFGSQPNQLKEKHLIDFSEGKYKYLLTKPKIAGSGCNFQRNCSTTIFVGIDYKFNDFIQAEHRVWRYGQEETVNEHIIFTRNEYEVLKVLKRKESNHKKLQKKMTELVKEYGLNSDLAKAQMERQIFQDEQKICIGDATLYNGDSTLVVPKLDNNSVDLIVTSIPFGDHYEYSDNYNDFGHNNGNEEFFKQMDYLTPALLDKLKPGRVAAIHVKDRIRYSHQNGTCFTTIDDFSGKTVAHFVKHGFYLTGKITVTTDVVRENNQTYRLGWSEQCKDSTKMGCGIPEYILLFRKEPTHKNNAYADDPVTHTKQEYSVAKWQLDAHSYHRSGGDRLLSTDEISKMDLKNIYHKWKDSKHHLYNFYKHLELCEDMDDKGKLSKLFMTIPPQSNTDWVWDDINRMNTLNAKQVSKKKEKHICPLQLDIIERLIERYSNKGETVLDPFGGLFSTPYVALQKGRKSISIELNPEYFRDGVSYVRAINYNINVPTLFDLA